MGKFRAFFIHYMDKLIFFQASPDTNVARSNYAPITPCSSEEFLCHSNLQDERVETLTGFLK